MRLPLRLRLTLVFGLGMAAVLVGLGFYGYSRVERALLVSVDAGLRSRAQILANSVSRSDTPILSEGRLIDPDEAIAQILDGDGAIVDASSAVASEPILTPAEVSSAADPQFATRWIEAADTDDPFRILVVAVNQPVRRIVIVGATLSDVSETLQRLSDTIVTTGPVVVLVLTLAGWLLAGAALAPVEEMRQQAAAVSASEPDRRLTVPQTGDELARLATTLNGMLDRLQEAIERERRFVDSASHELRTPLATLRGEIDLALIRPRDNSELIASLRSAQDDVRHLQRLTEDMLVLARVRGGRLPVRRARTDLRRLISKAMQEISSQTRDAGVDIEMDAPDTEVDLDPDRIIQALRNLLENAVRYTPRGGTVRIQGNRADGWVRFVVTDTGPGFPADILGSAFDPFTSGMPGALDPNRTGLGLAIVRAVAEAHGGTVSAENTSRGGQVTLDIRF